MADKEDSDTYTRAKRRKPFISARNEIKELRGRVTRSRLGLREHREEFRLQQATVRDLEARFWKGLQQHWENDVQLDRTVFGKLYEEIQAALDILGPAEEEYNEKEDDLDVLEYKLEIQEERFYDHLADIDPDDDSAVTLARTPPESHPARPPSTISDDAVGETSSMQQYLSRVGDANLIKERLLELRYEKLSYLDLEHERIALDLPLYQPNVEFLATFDETHSKYLEDLHRIEEDLSRLRVEAGLIDGGGGVLPLLTDASPKTPSLELTSQYVEPPRRRSDGDLLGIPVDASSARERINQWILDRLSNSQIEQARHKAILNDSTLDEDTWKARVGEYWQKDRAGSSSSHPSFQEKSGVSSTTTPILIPFQGSTENISTAFNEMNFKLDDSGQDPLRFKDQEVDPSLERSPRESVKNVPLFHSHSHSSDTGKFSLDSWVTSASY
ncbi:hypothetical protein MMC12_000140 [Toensbergia leucococca]|nr:hypothetical protein [Toensbergia leucococca]